MADPYPALGSNYRPPIETYTTNRGLTLTKDELTVLKHLAVEYLTTEPGSPGEALYNKITRL